MNSAGQDQQTDDSGKGNDGALTEEEVAWVRDAVQRTKRCRSMAAELLFSVVKWLVMGFFAALGWLLISGALVWTKAWLGI